MLTANNGALEAVCVALMDAVRTMADENGDRAAVDLPLCFSPTLDLPEGVRVRDIARLRATALCALTALCNRTVTFVPASQADSVRLTVAETALVDAAAGALRRAALSVRTQDGLRVAVDLPMRPDAQLSRGTLVEDDGRLQSIVLGALTVLCNGPVVPSDTASLTMPRAA